MLYMSYADGMGSSRSIGPGRYLSFSPPARPPRIKKVEMTYNIYRHIYQYICNACALAKLPLAACFLFIFIGVVIYYVLLDPDHVALLHCIEIIQSSINIIKIINTVCMHLLHTTS
jgi:hypothetical protein